MLEKTIHAIYFCRKARLQRKIASLRRSLEEWEHEKTRCEEAGDCVGAGVYSLTVQSLGYRLERAENKYAGVSAKERKYRKHVKKAA